jgi:DNA replication regulator SLD2
VRPRLLQAPEAKQPAEQSEDDEDEPAEAIPETQIVTEPSALEVASENEEDAYSDECDLSAEEDLPDITTVIEPSSSTKKDKKDKKKKSTENTETAKKSNKKKVKPEAHANYVKLKIKNQNSKAKGKGRFSRNKR